MNYLTAEDILRIHSFLIDETSGRHGVRDLGLIESAAAAPRQSFDGVAVHEDIFAKAAVLLKRLASHHGFVDGNKRTAVTAAAIFLEENGYQITAEPGELEDFAVSVVADDLKREVVAAWLEEESGKLA